MMSDNNGEGALQEPPQYDMLTVRFRGDKFDVVLPYCEVANGQITSILNEDYGYVIITLQRENGEEEAKISFVDFAKQVEKTFDTKEIVKLQIQQQGKYETHTII